MVKEEFRGFLNVRGISDILSLGGLRFHVDATSRQDVSVACRRRANGVSRNCETR